MLKFFTTDHGQRLRANTYCDDLSTASAIAINFKKKGSSDTATLTASEVGSDSPNYAVEATITDGWLDTKAGQWIGQVVVTWSTTAVISGEPFSIKIKAPPSA